MDKKIEQKNGLKKKHIYIAIATITFLSIVYYAFGTTHVSTYRANKDRLTVSAVTQNNFADYIRLMSHVDPISVIYLDAVEGGRVEEKLIEEGAEVKKGDVILRLSNPDLNLSILNSQANLAEQENFLRNTMVTLEQQKIANKQELVNVSYNVIRKKRAFSQNEKLYKDGLISQEDYLMAKEDYEIANKHYALRMEQYNQDSIYRAIQVDRMQDNLDNMEANLALVRQRIENLEVKASVDGQLGLLDAEIGQSISRGNRIGQINVLTDYKIVAKVDEHYIERVRRDLTASFERNGKEYQLRVKKVYPEVRDGRFTVDMVFTSERPSNIRTGQSYHVRLQLGDSSDAILVPRGSFFQNTGGQWIFVLDPSGEFATKRNIKIGRQNPRFYEVIEGLEPGEQVITSNYDMFGDNEKIVF
ncbi:efflux RND transporter periplasmic adaptor subunit [Saccharicrinis aurantiacus]|uniref:efflux RND transporter periplasmic adaptor subunit n=1 Tax=Saccharicrinis aurantiacus TaxID=1849719 RepID=UPI00094F720E|nr:efflux RND transporter periplasmic adaptor subunit [Saccharicrinis aurantiacus]